MKKKHYRVSCSTALALLLLSASLQAQEAGPDGQQGGVPAYVAAFENLAKEERENYGALKLKAQQFFRQKRIFEALEEVHSALKIYDGDPGLWNLKGSCYVEFRSFEKALESFAKAYEIAPASTGILFNLAEMDFVTKNWRSCIKRMTKLTSILEEEADGEISEGILPLHRLAIFKKMLSFISLGEKAKAVELAESYWDEWDDTPFTYYSKAALAYSEDNEEEATRWIVSAARVFGGIQAVGSWQDTMIEFGYVRSFYGGENSGDIEIESP